MGRRKRRRDGDAQGNAEHADHCDAALRAAAEEAVLRGQELAVLHIIAGVDEVLVNDPAVEQEVAGKLAE